jgi:hypothetical protein
VTGSIERLPTAPYPSALNSISTVAVEELRMNLHGFITITTVIYNTSKPGKDAAHEIRPGGQ